jgi:hypothetical protein
MTDVLETNEIKAQMTRHGIRLSDLAERLEVPVARLSSALSGDLEVIRKVAADYVNTLANGQNDEAQPTQG